jgi:hypothetical protein
MINIQNRKTFFLYFGYSFIHVTYNLTKLYVRKLLDCKLKLEQDTDFLKKYKLELELNIAF